MPELFWTKPEFPWTWHAEHACVCLCISLVLSCVFPPLLSTGTTSHPSTPASVESQLWPLQVCSFSCFCATMASRKHENCLPQCTSALTAFIYFPLLQFHMCTLHCSQISQTVLPGSVVSCLCGFHTCWFLYLEHHHHTHFIGLFYF